MAMNAPRRRLSPKEFAKESGLEVDHCSYHFRELKKVGCIALVDMKRRRGAVEHIYEARESALAWTSEWEGLKSELRRNVLTSVLGGGVHALGAAIDSGTFEARDDSHLSWDTIRVDNAGWQAISEILDRALKRLLRVEEESLARIADGSKGFLASYFLASFESSSKEEALGDEKLKFGTQPQPQLRPVSDKQRNRRREAREGQDEREIMAKVMRHPTRVRILMSMNTPRRRLSAKRFAEETGLALHHVSYHFAELEDTGCIVLVGTKQRRGMIEHIYEPRKTAIQWTDDWKLLGAAVKQGVLAAVARGAVEALGSAIDDGTFEARPSSHLSWSTIKVDEIGWARLAEIFDDALAELMALEKELMARKADGKPFPASYFMACFEAPAGLGSSESSTNSDRGEGPGK
jgi:hypothetical protein